MNTIQKIYHLYANHGYAEYSGQQASEIIKEELLKDKPSMIARLGSTELQAIEYYLNSKKPLRKHFEKLKKEHIYNKMTFNSGFFPSNDETIARFCEMMIRDAAEVDILGSWRKEERYLKDQLKHAVKVRLKDLEPYYNADPWTKILEGKNVLVVHPYAESINIQYAKRKLLFEDPMILPEFNLKTVKAVQSSTNHKSEFKDWFEALDSTKKQIRETEFDIAIIGCGSYGFPLAAFVKRMGKKAFHLGGAVQILFGIRGKRWEGHEFISKLMNENWKRPEESETPKDFIKHHNGSYW